MAVCKLMYSEKANNATVIRLLGHFRVSWSWCALAVIHPAMMCDRTELAGEWELTSVKRENGEEKNLFIKQHVLNLWQHNQRS